MKKLPGIVAICLLLTIFLPGQEQEPVDRITQLKLQIIALQNEGKPGVKNLCLCSSVNTFGDYVESGSNQFSKVTPFLIYYEPQNLFTRVVDGRYRIHFDQDFVLLSGDGKEELFRKEEMITMELNTKSPVMDLFATNRVALTGLPPAKYILKGIIHDRQRKDALPFEWKLNIEIVAK